jgi:ribosome-associated toxin RatA of RatAB toxin-antitoxin module
MAKVESSVVINAPLEDVFACAKNIEVFPEFMPDVKSVKILEKSDDGNHTISEFVAIVKEFRATIKWTEDDIWDPQAHTCKFTLVKGDFKTYDGLWTFEEVSGGTNFTSVIEYEYDIPLIGPMITTLVNRKMQENVDNMLAAIKAKLER